VLVCVVKGLPWRRPGNSQPSCGGCRRIQEACWCRRGADTCPPTGSPKRALTCFVTRAREGRGAIETDPQTDPHRPPGRRCGCWPTSPIPFLRSPVGGERWSGRQRRASAARYGVFDNDCQIPQHGPPALNVFSPNSRARGADPARSVSRATRTSRLGDAAAAGRCRRFLFRRFRFGADDGARAFGANDHAAAGAGDFANFLALVRRACVIRNSI
jgi:hypothetical protein